MRPNDVIGVLKKSWPISLDHYTEHQQCTGGKCYLPVRSGSAQLVVCRHLTRGQGERHRLCLIETAKANGLEPYAYLSHVLEHIGEADTVEKIEALLPWNVELAG